MSGYLNKVMIIGNVGKDPELKYTLDGTPNCRFSVAVTSTYKDKEGNQQENTEWFNVVAWGKLAETCGEYVFKGQKLYVEGRLQTRKWQTSDGETKYMTELVAQAIQMLSFKPREAQEGEVEPAGEPEIE